MGGLPLKKFFNTSGLLYKSMELKTKLPTMSEEEQFKLLATNGMLVKRPLMIGDGFFLVGFKEREWREKLYFRGDAMPLQIIRQDITKMNVDAIVNTTNEEMVGYSGVDFAVHEGAGAELDKECAKISPVSAFLKTPKLKVCLSGFAQIVSKNNILI